MIDTQSLRGKILDRALHGELTCQLPEDGTGAQLYQEIIEKRKELSKAGRIKNLKKLPEVSEDEWLFEIPHSWKWIRLGNVASIFGGKRIPAGRKLTTEDTGHKYIRVSEMKNETVIIEDMLYVPEDIYPSISQYIINKEDVYITVAGTIGRVGKIPDEIDGANLTENADRIVFDMIDQDWLISCLSSSEIQKEISLSTTQVAQPKLAIKRIEDLIIPLPPLNEQKRMVHILNQVFPILDTINALQDQYASNQEALKSKLIDAAIQGKLTEQLPEDGTTADLLKVIHTARKEAIKSGEIKKDTTIKSIDAEDVPCDIPATWEWVRLGSIATILGGKRIPAGRKLTTEDTGHKYIRVSEMKNQSVITEGLLYVPEDIYPLISQYIIKKEDVYITVAGTIGRVGTIPAEIDGANLTENADRIVFSYLDQNWLVFCLSSSIVQKQIEMLTTQVAQPKLAIKKIQEFLIPLPPLTEQKRIANKISAVLNLVP